MADFGEIAKELGDALNEPYAADDFKQTCGAALAIIKTHPQEVLRLAHARLHAFPFKDVPEFWRRLYCEACLWLAHGQLRKLSTMELGRTIAEDETISEAVRVLDMALIMTGAPSRGTLIHRIMSQLSDLVDVPEEPVRKRRRTSHDAEKIEPSATPRSFPCMTKTVLPPLRKPIERQDNLILTSFQKCLSASHTKNGHKGPLPLIISNSICNWPAMNQNAWSNPQYLLSRTIAGRRIVPVEVGSSYTDVAWGQKLQTMRQFMQENMYTGQVTASKRGYLAQHDIFAQIPALKEDILVPDYCYSEPPKRKHNDEEGSEDEKTSDDSGSSDVSEIMINAWFGPAHTVSPAHTDPHHNILAQIVGHKYVRLFPPEESSKMYARGQEMGVNMSNTSQVDVAEAMWLYEDWQGWDGDEDTFDQAVTSRIFEDDFPDFQNVQYLEGALEPGDCLYIPEGWWHYVRSLSPSFSVSFWWD